MWDGGSGLGARAIGGGLPPPGPLPQKRTILRDGEERNCKCLFTFRRFLPEYKLKAVVLPE